MMQSRLVPLLVLGVLALPGCTEEEATPAKPYYQFTADDQTWLLAEAGREWVFENAQGRQRRYRLRETTATKHVYATGAFGPLGATTHYYFDEWEALFGRTDSLEYFVVRIRRDLPAGIDKTRPPGSGSELSLQIRGDDMLGTAPNDLLSQGFRWVATNQPRMVLPVRGQQYAEVTDLQSSGSVCAICVRPRRIWRLYYDRQYGIVRMESVTGDVWDRVR